LDLHPAVSGRHNQVDSPIAVTWSSAPIMQPSGRKYATKLAGHPVLFSDAREEEPAAGDVLHGREPGG